MEGFSAGTSQASGPPFSVTCHLRSPHEQRRTKVEAEFESSHAPTVFLSCAIRGQRRAGKYRDVIDSHSS